MELIPVQTTLFRQLKPPASQVSQSGVTRIVANGDAFLISEEARARVAGLEAGIASLEQAAVQSRQLARKAAADKVSMAHEYLILLKRMSSPNDPAAAREAARIAREIKSATESYRGSLTKEELISSAKETAAFVTEAGKVLAIAREMVEQYLLRKKRISKEDGDMRDAVKDSLTSLRGLVQDGMEAGLQQPGAGSDSSP